MKRCFDIVLSFAGLLLLGPLMLLCAILVKLTSKGPVLFCQTRVGRDFRKFTIFKFRTMAERNFESGAQVTVDGDSRITPVGWFLRKTKLDETPQLWNVLTGSMSFVGPRPEVEKYVEMFSDEYRTLLQVPPGITGVASIAFRHEERILASRPDPQQAYVDEVLPAKIRLEKGYVRRSSVWLDLRLIFLTFAVVLGYPSPFATGLESIDGDGRAVRDP